MTLTRSSLVALVALTAIVNCDNDGVSDGVRRFHDGRVIYDLLAALRSASVPVNHFGFTEYASTFQGDTKAMVFREPNRVGMISEPITKAILRSLAGARDYTFLFTLKQNTTNVGTLVSFTSDNSRRLLELQSAWRKEELRLHYVMNQAANMIHVEKLAYQLADNLWHQLALTVSGSQVVLMVDCQKIYERVLYRPINEDVFRHGASLWLGQRGRWSSYFEGEMQEAMIVIGQHGSLEQCPHTESMCPTCGQHNLLAQAVELLQTEMHRVKAQLKSTEEKLELLAQCDCIIRCPYNGTFYEDGQTWDIGDCRQCTCQRGRVACAPKPCPPVACAFPVRMKGSCCPTCLRSCDLHGVVGGSSAFEHGMNVTSLSEIDAENNRICVRCQCKDGNLECFEPADHRTLCPPADCPAEQQRTNSFDCCPYCEGYNYCAKGHSCSPNADCVNMHNRYNCVCRPGYYGNGFNCVDIDECVATGEVRHKCGNHSMCVNTEGGYRCQCDVGFSHNSPYSCRDTDECLEHSHRCSQHAICTNSHGAHSCQCKSGYHGDGSTCMPVCQPKCTNGGSCVRPGICNCPWGFHGPRCELDLDECALGLHRCHANSECRNLPGSYHCVCRKGFTDSGRNNIFGTLCRDKNECAGRREKDFTCALGSRCINTVGAYKCLCDSATGCNKDCIYKASPHRRLRVRSGSSTRDLIDPCLVCSCHHGYLNCTKLPCNCSTLSTTVDTKCCPHCLASLAGNGSHGNALARVGNGSYGLHCWDSSEGKAHTIGSSWTRDCETCYCLSGEIQCHPLRCPPIACPHPVTRPGTCCPACLHADPCREGSTKARGLPGWQTAQLARRRGCAHAGRRLPNDARWRLGSPADCIVCQCRDGHICCSHDDQCDTALAAASHSSTSSISADNRSAASTAGAEGTTVHQSSPTSTTPPTSAAQTTTTAKPAEAADRSQTPPTNHGLPPPPDVDADLDDSSSVSWFNSTGVIGSSSAAAELAEPGDHPLHQSAPGEAAAAAASAAAASSTGNETVASHP